MAAWRKALRLDWRREMGAAYHHIGLVGLFGELAAALVPVFVGRADNRNSAGTLCCTVDGAGKPRHQIAREAGLHKDSLLRVIRGERPITLGEAGRILEACGAPVRATLALVLAGHEALVAQWMHHEMGAFLDEFFSALPGELNEAFGERIDDLRPRWAIGTSRLVARTLSKHIDEFADRDLSLAMGR